MLEPVFMAITGRPAFFIVLVFIILAIFPLVYYLLTLQRIFKEISPENRKMPPEQVWLSVIPLFGIVWQFFIVSRLSDSLSLELAKRNIYAEERRPAYNIGMAYCILISAVIVPYINLLASLGGLVCWVLFWLKVNDYRMLLKDNPGRYIEI